MNEKQKAKIIIKILNKIYPKAPVPLKSKNTFTLLISVLLSAQCTDVNVNNVTKDIYPKYYKPEHFVKLGRKKIERLIKSIGIFRVKAKSVYLLSKQIIKKIWSKLHLQIIFYGREYCKARDCYGLTCKICTTCYPNRKKPVITKKA